MLSDVLGFLIAQFVLTCVVLALAAFNTYQLFERNWFYRGPHAVGCFGAAIRDGLSDALVGEPWQPQIWWLFWLEILSYGLIGFVITDYLVFYQVEREPLWLAVVLVSAGLTLYCIIHEYFAQLPPGGVSLELGKTWRGYLRWGCWLRQFVALAIALLSLEATMLLSPTYDFVDLSRYLILSELQAIGLSALVATGLLCAVTGVRLASRLKRYPLVQHTLAELALRRASA